MTLLYLGLAALGVALALAWIRGLPGGAQGAALLLPLCLAVFAGRGARRGDGASTLCVFCALCGSILSFRHTDAIE